ncbi:uncharacterized protein BX663DRAFT_496001 [Cokeromyces recurvatus]|uniref:uncharacterized protein n=1 Tax=Cokeromyces recurvatus TaxID=90255 RepID=UPI00221F3CB8|nr:uncharacterized protein BX663DRAFT_496001 [Cokeromyces recurvatus]KAI7906320.1 hypothetical protein BX663DRAFT_496001 [Cokeromyces recurvatus]
MDPNLTGTPSSLIKEDPIYYDACRTGCSLVQTTGEYFSAINELKETMERERVTSSINTCLQNIVILYERIVASAQMINSSYPYIQNKENRFALVAAAQSSTSAALNALISLEESLNKLNPSANTKRNQEFKKIKNDILALINVGDVDFSHAIKRMDPTETSLMNNNADTTCLKLVLKKKIQENEDLRQMLEGQIFVFERERDEFRREKNELERERSEIKKQRFEEPMVKSLEQQIKLLNEDKTQLGARIHEFEELRRHYRTRQIITLSAAQFLQTFENTVNHYAKLYKGYTFETVWRNMLVYAAPQNRQQWIQENIVAKRLSWDKAKELYMNTFPEPTHTLVAMTSPSLPTSSSPASTSTSASTPAPIPIRTNTNFKVDQKSLLTKREQRVANFAEKLFSAKMVYQENISKYNKKFIDACKLAKMDLSDEMLMKRYKKSLLPEYSAALERYIQQNNPIITDITDMTTLAEIANNSYNNNKRKRIKLLEHKHTKRL